MIAKFLQESILMKNKSTEEMENIIKGFGFDNIPHPIDYKLSDGTPGSWFVKDGDEGKFVFISHSFRGTKGIRDRIVYIFHNDSAYCQTDWDIIGFGKSVSETDTEGIKKMSSYVRDIMNTISRKSSVTDIIRFINLEHDKNVNTVWGKMK